jgi:hypothetical protein
MVRSERGLIDSYTDEPCIYVGVVTNVLSAYGKSIGSPERYPAAGMRL